MLPEMLLLPLFIAITLGKCKYTVWSVLWCSCAIACCPVPAASGCSQQPLRKTHSTGVITVMLWVVLRTRGSEGLGIAASSPWGDPDHCQGGGRGGSPAPVCHRAPKWTRKLSHPAGGGHDARRPRRSCPPAQPRH